MQVQAKRCLSALAAVEYRFLEFALLTLLAINTISIVARYIFNHAIGELFEVMLLGSVALYWLGVATADRVGGHLGMDLFVSMLPSGLQQMAVLLRKLVVLGFLAVVVYSGTNLSLSQFGYGTSSGILGLPLWLFSAFIPFGCALLAWRTVFVPRSDGADGEAVL